MAMSREKTCDGAAARTRRWVGTWADVEQAQLETMLAATPAQRLAWLEEAMRLAYASGALRADRRAPPSPAPAGRRLNLQVFGVFEQDFQRLDAYTNSARCLRTSRPKPSAEPFRPEHTSP